MFLASSSNGQESWSRAQDEYVVMLSAELDSASFCRSGS